LADLQTYYKVVFEGSEDCLKSVSLGGVCKQLCGKEICKGERMSNWERRPLREAQMHYGTLDAYCMIPAIKACIERAGTNEAKSLKKHVQAYDMVKAKAAKAEESKEGEKKDNYKKGGRGHKGKYEKKKTGGPQEGGKPQDESKGQKEEGPRKVYYKAKEPQLNKQNSTGQAYQRKPRQDQGPQQ